MLGVQMNGLVLLIFSSNVANASRVANIGLSSAECSVTTAFVDDMDDDLLLDACERLLAEAFEPYLHFYGADGDPARRARRPKWAVQWDYPFGMASGMATIYYAFSYENDFGVPGTGVTSHYGDTEFVIVNVIDILGGEWLVSNIFLSAHFDAPTDSSDWVWPTLFDYETGLHGVGHPVIHVAENKHANYVDTIECDLGGATFDNCNGAPTAQEWLGISLDGNLGSRDVPLLSRDVDPVTGHAEAYWSSLRFCGWQVAGQDNSLRSDCTSAQNTYDLQLEHQSAAFYSQPSSVRRCVDDFATSPAVPGRIVPPVQSWVENGQNDRIVATLRQHDPSWMTLRLYRREDRGLGPRWYPVTQGGPTDYAQTVVFENPQAGRYAWAIEHRLNSTSYSLCAPRLRP
jgi:hypothetical protein